MSDRIFVGIDPGTMGGIVAIEPGESMHAIRFSRSTWSDVAKFICDVGYEWPNHLIAVMIEKVGAMPGNGVSGMFKFGKAAGIAEGIVLANGLPHRFVTPQQWQRAFITTKKGEPKTQHKRRLKEVAQRLFPGEKIGNEIADAYLLAEYCRRHW